MIAWNYIMDKQPEHGRSIVQVDAPYGGRYTMGMRDYYQGCTYEQLLEWNKKNEIPDPNFWWVYAEDFPFPDKHVKPLDMTN